MRAALACNTARAPASPRRVASSAKSCAGKITGWPARPSIAAPRQIRSGAESNPAITAARSSACNSGISAGSIINPAAPSARATPARIDAAMPSAASGTMKRSTGNPASASDRAGRSGGRATSTRAPVAKAACTLRASCGTPSTTSSSLSPPRIREEAPAARIRIAGFMAPACQKPKRRSMTGALLLWSQIGPDSSAAHPRAIGVEQGRQMDGGAATFAQDLDLAFQPVAHLVGRQEALRQRFAGEMREPATGTEAHNRAVKPDRLPRHNVRVIGIDDERHQFPLRPCGLLGGRGSLADPVSVLVPADETVQSGFAGGVIGAELAPPRPEPLVQTQAHHRPHPEGTQAQIGAGGVQRVPQMPDRHVVAEDLIAQIGGVADALHDAV